MGSCRNPQLEPGPLEELQADPIVDEPFVPFATKRATEFAERTSGLFAVLDAATVALEAEQALDLFGDLTDVGASFTSVTAAAVNPEALAHLKAAEDGFRVARDKAAALGANIPADVQQPTVLHPLDVVVQRADGHRLAGALVTIDADFGNGTTRVTDGDGRVNFGVGTSGVLAYTVDADGYARGSGTITLGTTFLQVVTLTPLAS